VCKECSGYGVVLGKAKPQTPNIPKQVETPRSAEEPEKIETIVPDFAQIIRKKREQMGLKQEEFAKRINEKESLIHKIETGTFTPSIKLARKIERFLHVKLVQEEVVAARPVGFKKTEASGLTLGDAIKIRKKSKK
ncbi:multiprotein-bridging factor 1 family protein, partial [Candidatus Woesearchaeota archaeon]|nr:multiprotein-bridging factor 1 family protein [Candidatus Woesearchaeota archaeon]